MTLKSLVIDHAGSELFAVPAAHFDHVFALEVHRICAHPATRPEAVAVELGPGAVAAATQWLKELGVGPGARNGLPVMLGLLKNNRMIRASLKEKALALQRESGKDLSDLPAEALNRELGFLGCSALCLSPIDSIIEAVRCGVELEVPVYGVDLEETADGVYKPVVVQDSSVAGENLVAYTDHNASYAEHQRDEEIDGRREIVMAARLKTLLRQYRRVLFTGGLAHWLRLRSLLADASIRPAEVPGNPWKAPGEYRRVVVHPLIAVRYMDSLPALVRRYEESRAPAFEPPGSAKEKMQINPYTILRNQMTRAYRNYFGPESRTTPRTRRNSDLELLGHFEAYLTNRCLLNHRLAPDLSLTVQCAGEMFSREFVKELSKTLMEFPWATLEEHPGCTLLSPPTAPVHEPGAVVLTDADGEEGEHFWIRSLPGLSAHSHPVEIPFEWDSSKSPANAIQLSFLRYTWLPWDFLITSMSLRAMRNAKAKRSRRRLEVFADSLLHGIDVKATLRSFSRGKESVYVRDLVKGSCNDIEPPHGFPVVWILRPEKNTGGCWNVLMEPCGHMEDHVRDRQLFNRIRKHRGDNMVALIGYGDLDQEDMASARNSRIKSDRYRGIITFLPLCLTNKQYARWAELTHYRRNPFCDDCHLDAGRSGDLTRFYEKKHGVKIGALDWPTTMILLAIPFAESTLTVVIPDNYRIERLAFDRARQCGVTISTVSLSLFSEKEIERVSRCYVVPVITHEPHCIYSESIEKAIGESQTDNRHLVPETWRDFGSPSV